jgi:hypothetical protein
MSNERDSRVITCASKQRVIPTDPQMKVSKIEVTESW